MDETRNNARGAAIKLNDGRTGSGWIAYVGSRTTAARNGKGKGLSVYAVDARSGAWTLLQVVEGLVNPSFLTLNRAHDRLYAVHGDHAEVSSFAVDPADGTLRFLNWQPCGGTNPVHLELSIDERELVVANYATGTIAVLPVATDGSLEPVRLLLGLPGSPGPHRIEQNSPHPHHALRFTSAGRSTPWHIVPDKGLDAVFAIRIGVSAAETQINRFRSRECAGPRHAAFHPALPLVYIGNELDSTVTTLAFDEDAGTLQCVGHVSTLPGEYSGPNRVAGIVMHPSGRMLYVSNRGHDSVACLPLDVNGLIAPLAATFVPSLGHFPRFITLTPDGRRLLVANERSHTIVSRALESDRLLPLREAALVETGSPVCVVFAGHAR
ncbi:lactonase family protein [Paraburkholderia edwinii]|uniref:lactonase family protein n=1 Tax=Paraburkholderia edwinii TaxID=2861782 RepID=UPI001FE30DF1|nr:lactonase family protein [Paraburkholderia edwinii]